MKPTIFDIVKFFVAALLAFGMLYIHAYVKDIPTVILAMPFALMGIDFSKLPLIGGKK